MATTWYQPQNPQATQGVFTTFVNGEPEVQNYLVPAGGMAILIDLNGGKMWFKSVSINGMPSPLRMFEIKEKTVAPQSNLVTRDEFNTLSRQMNQITQMLQNMQQPVKEGGTE